VNAPDVDFQAGPDFESRKRTWPIEAVASSVPFRTSACILLCRDTVLRGNGAGSAQDALKELARAHGGDEGAYEFDRDTGKAFKARRSAAAARISSSAR